MRKLGIIGIFGSGERFATGQAVKTRVVFDWFGRKLGADQVLAANIYGARKKPFTVLKNIVSALKNCENIIFIPGQNVDVFAPAVAVLNLLFRRKIHYVVIGGNLADVIKEHPLVGKAISCFSGVYVESVSLRCRLRGAGISAAEYLPNCRDYVPEAPPDAPDGGRVHICTYSRVTKNKGILDAIEICRKANEMAGSDLFLLDIYGKLYKDFVDEFNAALKENAEIAVYRGYRESGETVETLRNYFAILFPTYYKRECFAGTVIDAFSARIPVIVNDWLYNSEVIKSGVNGFIYPFRDNAAAAKILVNLYRDPGLYRRIQSGCEKSAVRYSTDNVLGGFCEIIFGDKIA